MKTVPSGDNVVWRDVENITTKSPQIPPLFFSSDYKIPRTSWEIVAEYTELARRIRIPSALKR